jgi:hypothetical protein
VIRGSAPAFVFLAVSASHTGLTSAQAFPSNVEWLAVTRAGTRVGDSPEDEPRGELNVVGGGLYPAAYVARDDTFLFFRVRVAEDPNRSGGAAVTSAWGAALDMDLDAGRFEFLALAKDFDAPRGVVLLENSASSSAGDARDVAETELAAYSGRQYARVDVAPSSVNGSSTYFVSWAIRAEELALSGPIRAAFGTSSSGDRLDADLFGGESSSLLEILSDPVNCSGVSCVSCEAACGTDCVFCEGDTPVCDAESGTCVPRPSCSTDGDCPQSHPHCLASSLCGTCSPADPTSCPETEPLCNERTGDCEACQSDEDCMDRARPWCRADGACAPDPSICVPTESMKCDPQSITVTGGSCDCRAAPGSARSSAPFTGLLLTLSAWAMRRGRTRARPRE